MKDANAISKCSFGITHTQRERWGGGKTASLFFKVSQETQEGKCCELGVIQCWDRNPCAVQHEAENNDKTRPSHICSETLCKVNTDFLLSSHPGDSSPWKYVFGIPSSGLEFLEEIKPIGGR